MTIETLGIDIAKTVFQLHGVNRSGRLILKRRMMRDQLLQVIAQTEPCTIAIEACTGAFYWQRKFEEHGHKVVDYQPAIRQALRAAPEDRRQRCRSHLHRSPTGAHAENAGAIIPH